MVGGTVARDEDKALALSTICGEWSGNNKLFCFI
jgi:hypothetical protein